MEMLGIKFVIFGAKRVSQSYHNVSVSNSRSCSLITNLLIQLMDPQS